MANVIGRIRELISIDDLPTTIQLFHEIKSNYLDEIVLQSARHNDLIRQIRLGVIEPSEARIEKNGIRLALLEVLNLIEIEIQNNSEFAEEISRFDFSEFKEDYSETTLRFVSSNLKKFNEYEQLLNPIKVIFSELDIDEIQNINIETIARNKVETLKPIFGDLPFFVDETALIIDSWNGLPGGMTDQFFNRIEDDIFFKLLKGFQNKPISARAQTIIGFSNKNNVEIFTDTVAGYIAINQASDHYDFSWGKFFVPEGYDKSYSHLGFDVKNKISMRSLAAQKFKYYLSQKNYCM